LRREHNTSNSTYILLELEYEKPSLVALLLLLPNTTNRRERESFGSLGKRVLLDIPFGKNNSQTSFLDRIGLSQEGRE
jgi:hypothetical protein